MIKVIIPNNNIEERKYILDVFFNDFLGLDYYLEINNSYFESWELILENNTKIIFRDHFFNKYLLELQYLNSGNIPLKIKFLKNQYIVEDNIPVIYGNDDLIVSETCIICGIDIFASSFFMLTRWEEYVNKTYDKHKRFSARESLAFKNNFLDRPVVNEYIEMLKKMLISLDNNLLFKKHTFQYIFTHDVDHIEKWDTLKKFCRHLMGDLIKRKSVKEFSKSIVYFIKVRLKIKNDPYDTFDYLMSLSEKLESKSYFFFMAKGLTNFDNRYKINDKKVIDLVNKIKKRKHWIGIHPTYNAYNNFEQLKSEIIDLEEQFDINVSFGRNHYLRFEVPTTWQIWDDNKLMWDSTCGYADKEGFRCGVCYEYSVFNIISRKKLYLREKPLIVMDGTLQSQKEMNKFKMQENILKLIKKVKYYDGEFVILWHNSSFNISERINYNKVYEEVLI